MVNNRYIKESNIYCYLTIVINYIFFIIKKI